MTSLNRLQLSHTAKQVSHHVLTSTTWCCHEIEEAPAGLRMSLGFLGKPGVCKP